MVFDKPMPLLLIEDDVVECVKFKDCANSRTDITFVGMTDSSEDALTLLKTRLPEGVIVDLQLVDGEGSGLQFLDEFYKADMAFRPVVVVTTGNRSRLVRDHIEAMGVDWIFSKNQRGYCADFVVSTLLRLRKSLYAVQGNEKSRSWKAVESPEDRRAKINKRIDAELDCIGIRARLKGRDYLHEGIYLQIQAGKKAGSVIDQVARNQKITYASVIRGMQTAIDNAWSNAPIVELQVHYTARISEKTGTPSASDFIFYYADKIRKTL